MNLILLHGFWGQPADWSPILSELPLNVNVWTPDLFEPGPLAPHHSLKEWTDHFLEDVGDRFGDSPVEIAGYSMGARLALAAVMKRPDRFSRAVLMSCDPRRLEGREAEERLAWEMTWVGKFREAPWDVLRAEWESQPVFVGSAGLKRRESDRLREMLAQALVHWSRREHPWSESDIRALPESVQWVYGALDQKYLPVAESLRNLPVRGPVTIVPGVGHRVLNQRGIL